MAQDAGGHPESVTADLRHNVLLGSLPDEELARIAPSLEPVILPRGTELDAPDAEIEFVYFPTSGVASILAIGTEGESVDTAIIGREGMTGLAVFLGTGQMPVRTLVQVSMVGFRLPTMISAPSSSVAACWSTCSSATPRS